MPNLPVDSVQIARAYMESLLVEGRIIGAQKPSTEFAFLNKKFETPIMTAALSHLDLPSMAEGAMQAGTAVSIGMGSNEEMARVLKTGASVIKIIKPYADEKEIFSRIAFAEAHGAMAVGMDVEHAVNVEDAENACVAGIPMKLPTVEELSAYIHSTQLPFFIKGALSVRDAEQCVKLGCKGIVLSHHNGLLRYAVPPIMVLPKIREAVGDQLLLIVDGGISSGYDAFKALALGADAVTVGRALIEPLKKDGASGVRNVLDSMTRQLQAMMIRTGVADLRHMDPSIIWHEREESAR